MKHDRTDLTPASVPEGLHDTSHMPDDLNNCSRRD